MDEGLFEVDKKRDKKWTVEQLVERLKKPPKPPGQREGLTLREYLAMSNEEVYVKVCLGITYKGVCINLSGRVTHDGKFIDSKLCSGTWGDCDTLTILGSTSNYECIREWTDGLSPELQDLAVLHPILPKESLKDKWPVAPCTWLMINYLTSPRLSKQRLFRVCQWPDQSTTCKYQKA